MREIVPPSEAPAGTRVNLGEERVGFVARLSRLFGRNPSTEPMTVEEASTPLARIEHTEQFTATKKDARIAHEIGHLPDPERAATFLSQQPRSLLTEKLEEYQGYRTWLEERGPAFYRLQSEDPEDAQERTAQYLQEVDRLVTLIDDALREQEEIPGFAEFMTELRAFATAIERNEKPMSLQTTLDALERVAQRSKQWWKDARPPSDGKTLDERKMQFRENEALRNELARIFLRLVNPLQEERWQIPLDEKRMTAATLSRYHLQLRRGYTQIRPQLESIREIILSIL